MLSGYGDLKDLVDVIASMNKALLTIAPAIAPVLEANVSGEVYSSSGPALHVG